MRKLVALILLSAVSTGVLALGLGNIELNSGLNQPFDARIELLSPKASELDSLTVALGDIDAFNRAGIDRPFILSSLRFEVVQSVSGQDYIRVTSREVMREPFLNFLIEASWASGRLFREYTVLLDPPLYDPNPGRSVSTETGAQQTAPASASADSTGGNQLADSVQTAAPFSGNEIGPTSSNDTLWSVANRVRPDDSVSVNQMMIALLRANPEAFVGNNINALKQGQILRVPAPDEVTSTTYEAALEEARSQNALWEEMRGTIAANTTKRPASSSVEPASNVTAPTSENQSELRLLAASDQSADAGQTSGTASNANSDASIGLLNEQMESMTSENAGLRDRLSKSETIIDDLKRLIQLKDDELATLQQQINGDTPEQSILDQIIGFAVDNIVIVGGGIGGLVLIAALVGFVRKRKSAAPVAVVAKAEVPVDVAPAQQVAEEDPLGEVNVFLDIGGISPEPADENMIDFDAPSVSTADEGGIELDFGSDSTSAGDSGLELSMDLDSQDDGGIELDFSGMDDAKPSLSIDMDSTVQIPKSAVPKSSVPSLDMSDDDDDHTVFVPRTNNTGEQSAEDENATRLDLAKAYVELGEKSKAKSILEEVMADGNPAQKRQAQELLGQIR